MSDTTPKTVIINTSSLQSMDKQVLTPEEALAELKRQKANGMWAFIDGKETDVSLLSEEDLLNAEDIALMYEIQGG